MLNRQCKSCFVSWLLLDMGGEHNWWDPYELRWSRDFRVNGLDKLWNAQLCDNPLSAYVLLATVWRRHSHPFQFQRLMTDLSSTLMQLRWGEAVWFSVHNAHSLPISFLYSLLGFLRFAVLRSLTLLIPSSEHSIQFLVCLCMCLKEFFQWLHVHTTSLLWAEVQFV